MFEVSNRMDITLHPKSQMTLIGHNLAQNQLRQAFHKGAMPPVWLIAGERGIGKATLAYTITREILTHEGQNPDVVTRQIVQGSYPNFLSLERYVDENGKISREITVDEVRKVSNFIHQSASIPGWRVVIIDAVDEMNRNAANALLKILEEPPVKTVFLLIAHSLGQVLPTIRSRCCKLQLYPLTDDEMRESLGMQFSPEILTLANGSLGRASALQQVGGTLFLEQITQAIRDALKGNWHTAQKLSSSLDKDNSHYEVVLDLIAWVLYRLIMLSNVPFPPTPGDSNIISLNQLKPMTHWVDAFDRINEFLRTAKTSHLDSNHIVMAIFFMIENPMTGDEFIYGQF